MVKGGIADSTAEEMLSELEVERSTLEQRIARVGRVVPKFDLEIQRPPVASYARFNPLMSLLMSGELQATARRQAKYRAAVEDSPTAGPAQSFGYIPSGRVAQLAEQGTLNP